MAGTLYIVGTPIGNLEDITMRALRVLREVDLIAAEDTRRTSRLLQHYSIVTPTTSLHEHNERGKTPHLIARLQGGESIALVSDAGMPLVSDPGADLVKAGRQAGISIQVVPGPSAVTTALAAAGVAGPFCFLGFPPSSGAGRRKWLSQFGRMTEDVTVVFFESPHRLRRTLGDLAAFYGERPILVAKELTKIHEILVEQPINEWLAAHDLPEREKGEFVVVAPVRDSSEDTRVERPSDAILLAEIGRLTNSGMKPRAAAKTLAERYAVTASEVYDLHTRQSE